MSGNSNQTSILATIKKMLGLDVNYDAFDVDVVVHINSALMTLQQLGVGPEEGFFIDQSNSQTWDDLFPSNHMLEAVKTYIYLSVKMVFDPPGNSFVMDAMKSQKEELGNRLKEQARFFNPEAGKYTDPVSETTSSGDDTLAGFGES